MSHGFAGSSRDHSRRRRWVSQWTEELPPPPVWRSSAVHPNDDIEPAPILDGNESPQSISSILPRPVWALVLMIAGGILAWSGVISIGVWLDLQQLDPWQDIFGLRTGRLLRFYNTTALLTCAQLSYLILWRRSGSRKDFAGKYRVWFWVGAVCSVFCVATATRFHESWSQTLTRRANSNSLGWATIFWMVPATSMLMSAMHLMRRDMPYRSASTTWAGISRVAAIAAGLNILLGSLVWPNQWIVPINAALSSLWPTLFASTLLIHARFVTYVTNEAALERRQPSRASRWEARIRLFVRKVTRMANEEWQLYLTKRAAAKAAHIEQLALAKGGPQPASAPPVAEPSTVTRRPRKGASTTASAKATAPLRVLSEQYPAVSHVNAEATEHLNLTDGEDEQRDSEESDSRPILKRSTINIHPAQPIPAPHFDVNAAQESQQVGVTTAESALNSETVPPGITAQQWKQMSKKDRKKAQRSQSLRAS